MIIKNKTKKLISAFLLILIIAPAVLFSRPKQVNAAGWPVVDVIGNIILGKSSIEHTITTGSTVVNTGLHIKDIAVLILQQLVTSFERKLLATMTQDTVNWINSGFHGSPLFIQNPDSFFKDIAKYEIKNLVTMFGYDPNRFPFGESFALNLINGYKRTVENDAAYSLSKVINDPALLNSYRNNFNTGGWNGFLINTQYPQNNYLGFQMMATDLAARKLAGTVQTATQKVQTALSQGMGFLSPKMCADPNTKYNNGKNEFQQPSWNESDYINKHPMKFPDPKDYAGGNDDPAFQADYEKTSADWFNAKQDAQANWTKDNTCKNLVATTPGSVVGNRIMTALGSDFQKTALGSMITNSLSAIFDSLMNHFMDKGLAALASAVSPAPPVDNWTYKGNSLENNTTITGSTGTTGTTTTGTTATATIVDFNNPPLQSVDAGGIDNITFSGGTAPYAITRWSDTAKVKLVFLDDTKTTLTITGVAPGQTSFDVQDSSTPAKKTTVQVLVTSASTSSINFDTGIPLSILIDSNNPNNVANIMMSGGNPDYSLQTQGNPEIAQGQVFGNTLMIAAIGPGKTSIVVQDSSTPAKTVIVQVTIGTPSSSVLSASPQNISGNTGNTNKVILSGGLAPYSIETDPDSAIAIAYISDTALNVSGAGAGTTSITIKDSSFPVKTITIPITISEGEAGGGSETVSFDNPFPQNTFTGTVGTTASLTLSGGTPPYILAGTPNSAFAIAELSGSTLSIKGVKAGPTSVILSDSSGKTITVDITINPAGAL